MRLLTVDARTTGRDRAALAHLIETADCDIACVHRAPQLLRWRSISAAIGRRSGLVVVGGGRPAAANLLLSKLGVDSLRATDVALGGSRLDSAGAALALLRIGGVGGAEFVFAGVRLTGDSARRVEQAQALAHALEHFVPSRPPVLLAVDGVGDGRGGAASNVLRQGRRELGAGLFVDERVVAGEPTALTSAPAGGSRIVAPTTVEITLS